MNQDSCSHSAGPVCFSACLFVLERDAAVLEKDAAAMHTAMHAQTEVAGVGTLAGPMLTSQAVKMCELHLAAGSSTDKQAVDGQNLRRPTANEHQMSHHQVSTCSAHAKGI